MSTVAGVLRRAMHVPALLVAALAVLDWEGSELFADDLVGDEA
jgi:hypothetical protein